MSRYLLSRVMQLVPVLFIISLVVFAIMHVLPGDPAELMLAGAEGGAITPERLAELQGADGPRTIRWSCSTCASSAARVAGRSRRVDPLPRAGHRSDPRPLRLHDRARGRRPRLSLAIGLPLGMLAAVRQNSWVDTFAMGFAYVGASMPVYWVGLVLILVFSFNLGWFPPAGADSWRSLVLPALHARPRLGRRHQPPDPLEHDRGAVGGLHPRRPRQGPQPSASSSGVTGSRTRMIPVITMVGLQFGAMLAGAVVTETVFSRPGIGRLVVSAILQKDYPLVQGCVVFLAAVYLLVNLLVDLAYAWLDPRIRYGALTHADGHASRRPPRPADVDEQPVRQSVRLQWLRDLLRNKGAVARRGAPRRSGSSSRCSAPHDRALRPGRDAVAAAPAAVGRVLARHRPARARRLQPHPGRRADLAAARPDQRRARRRARASCSASSPAISAAGSTRCSRASSTRCWRFPSILLALVVIAALGPSIRNVMISVGIATHAALCPPRAQQRAGHQGAALCRGGAGRRQSDAGASCSSTCSSTPTRRCSCSSTLQVGNAILIGSGLSFLGLGAQPPTPEWGLMSAEGREVLNRAWWISTFPGSPSSAWSWPATSSATACAPRSTRACGWRSDRDASRRQTRSSASRSARSASSTRASTRCSTRCRSASASTR